MCDELLFNRELPIRFGTSKSSFVLAGTDSPSAIMETSIGQGKTLVTPLHMALITSAIANDGVLMTPSYVIDHTTDHKGNTVEQYEPKEYGALLSYEESAVLKDYMKAVVEEGTAKKLANDDYEVYGKTGSAEFSSTPTQATHGLSALDIRREPQILRLPLSLRTQGSEANMRCRLRRKFLMNII